MKRQDFLYKHLKEGTILDVGNAAYGGEYHRRLMAKYPQSTFYGLDVMKIEGERQYTGSCDNMPFADAMFDTVYMGEVIEHVWDPLKVVQEAYRVLKPGGIFIFDTPNVYSLSRMLRFSLRRMDDLGDPDHKIFLSRASLNKLLKTAGFTLVELTTENNFSIHKIKFQFPTSLFWHFGECNLVAARKI